MTAAIFEGPDCERVTGFRHYMQWDKVHGMRCFLMRPENIFHAVRSFRATLFARGHWEKPGTTIKGPGMMPDISPEIMEQLK